MWMITYQVAVVYGQIKTFVPHKPIKFGEVWSVLYILFRPKIVYLIKKLNSLRADKMFISTLYT